MSLFFVSFVLFAVKLNLPVRTERNRAHRRQSEEGGERLAVGLVISGVDAAKISLVAPAEKAGVRINGFPPESALGKTDAVIMP